MTDFNPGYLLNAIVYSALGVVLFALALGIAGRAVPFDYWKEIRENGNVAVAIVVGAIAISLAIIVASSVH